MKKQINDEIHFEYSDYENTHIPRISIEKLKQLTGDANISENEADEIITSLYKLSVIAIHINNNI